MKKKHRILIMIAGAVLICAGAGLAAHNLYMDYRAARRSADIYADLKKISDRAAEGRKPAGIAGIPLSDRLSGDMPSVNIDGEDYIGTVTLSSLGIELPVAAGWSYPQMKLSPCRYSGSAYDDTLVICAHNYASHFGNIKNLLPGDTVLVEDVEGNVFNYEVKAVETLDPYAVNEMKSSGWDLSLFTCTLGGQARVTARCSRADG